MLRIATRESPLALWQARHVQALLATAHPQLAVELLPMTTLGDQLLDRSLSKVGGKGLFVKELEQAMLEGRADIAVHSMKDVPALLPDGLGLFAYLAADDPRDALVSNHFNDLDALPQGAVVGTASLRRQAQLRLIRPDLQVRELRGNVNTRLRKLDDGLYDAIVLARAGLERLGLGHRIAETLTGERFLPAIAQGVIGIECRDDDAATQSALAPIHSAASAIRLAAERAFNARLGGACQVPVAGHARVDGDRLRLIGLVAAPDGSASVRDEIEGPASTAAQLGAELADRLLGAGGRRILRDCGIDV